MRKNRIRIYRELQNGQCAMLQARRWELCHEGGVTQEHWHVGAAIGRHRKACRMALRDLYGRPNQCGKLTGKCGLSGLRALSDALHDVENQLDSRALKSSRQIAIIVHPWGDKHRRAYRYLERFGYCFDRDGDYYKVLR